MNEDTFRRNARVAGFNPTQIDFMWICLAKIPHNHKIEEVIGLEGELEELGYEPGEENDLTEEDDEEE